MSRSVADHQRAVRQLLGGLAGGTGESVGLEDGLGRILVADVTAPIDLPRFDNSQMDGYAVATADLSGATHATATGSTAVPGQRTTTGPTAAPERATESGPGMTSGQRTPVMAGLPVGPTIAAGVSPEPLRPGTAVPIMTGAMMPVGADTVVPIEAAVPDTFYPEVPGGGGQRVELPADYPGGRYIRAAGSDIAAGTVALSAGTVLGPGQLGLAAALGIDRLSVRRRPRVLLVSTGDEVVAPGSPLRDGQIYDANTTLLASSLTEAGADVVTRRLFDDDPASFRDRLLDDLTAGGIDLLLTCGGISKGAFEVVRRALGDAEAQFVSVAMQPGGPQGIGRVAGVPFLGFPGNPVSSLVSFEMFLRPALTDVVGHPRARSEANAALAEAVDSPGHKYQLRRGSYDPATGTVRLIGGPGSHLLSALAASNALIHLPDGVTRVEAHDRVRTWLL